MRNKYLLITMNRATIKLSAMLLLITTISASAQERLKADGEIPIVAWHGLPTEQSTVERYLEMKESGINTNLRWMPSIEALETALKVAQKTGIKLITNCPELSKDTESTVKKMMKYHSLAGYYIADEPNTAAFPKLAELVKKIQSIDKKHYCYVNLLPNYAAVHQLGLNTETLYGKEAYEEYVAEYVKQFPTEFISFDYYPVVNGKGTLVLRKSWYKNLEIVAKACRESGRPMWAFALAVAHVVYPVPTVGQLKLQMYSNLAYGAQALQYFTYWNPRNDPVYDYNTAPIGLDDKRSVVYDRIKLVNNEIQSLAGVFLGSEMLWVHHTGKSIPDGTTLLGPLPEHILALETSDGGAVVSLLEKGNRQFLVIVNRDFQNPMKLTVATDEKVKKVLKDATLVPANAYTPVMEVDPGDVAIYTWKQ